MSVWYIITAAFFLFVVLEESIYYSWNRYVYGKNVERRGKWKHRWLVVLRLFKRNKRIVVETKNQEKSSSL
ncbi:hypothetical protein L1999_11730 [Neobacillus drentensis]|uniref:hypothetical protein n=1 Tax=Neobacillus drentensis TaxID=220684 RepID=UPI001F1DB971|nr:hypothetical protein [Neobacillus drentensis]ULT59144.1 hypothetical protein L1999_11730 [Neobacillus drentensis]